MSAEDAKNSKKGALLSKKEVEAKFVSKGVTVAMIREACGTPKYEVSSIRQLLAIFEEAYLKGWDVVNGPWATAVAFYKQFLQANLAEKEQEPRERLIVDFLKRCWDLVQRGEGAGQQQDAEGGAAASESAMDTRVSTSEVVIPATTGLEGVPLIPTVKPTPSGGVGSVPATITPQAKVAPPTDAEVEEEYQKGAALIAAERAKRLAAVHAEIEKKEAALEETRRLHLVERLDRERLASSHFENEMLRARERLDGLDRDQKNSASGYKIQSTAEYERTRRGEAQSRESRGNLSQEKGGGDRGRGLRNDLKGDRDRDSLRSANDHEDSERKRFSAEGGRSDHDRDGYFGRGGRDSSRHVEERGRDSRSDNWEASQLGKDPDVKTRDREDRDRHEDNERRDRALRDERREREDRRDRWFHDEGIAILAAVSTGIAPNVGGTPVGVSAKPKGNPEILPPGVSVEGEAASQESMAKLVKMMQTPEIMSVYAQSRLAEALKIRCASSLLGGTGNVVENALTREHGVGILQTVAGVIAESLAMHFPAKLLDMLRKSPRANWPLAAFSKINLEKSGSSESFMVQVQLSQGVVHTKSNGGKLIEQWETVNDILEPLRRYTSLMLVFDALYGQALSGLLGVVTREMMYSEAGAARLQVKPAEIHRLKIYVELIRFHYGGENLSATTVHKFLHYCNSTGEEAQRNLSDLLRLEAKELESGRGKGKRADTDKKGSCFDFNAKDGCPRERCRFTHACSKCGKEDHAIGKCPKSKAT